MELCHRYFQDGTCHKGLQIQWASKVLQYFAVSDCMQCGTLWNGNHT
jgi:hypothetical protein